MDRHGESQGAALLKSYGDAFGAGYKDRYPLTEVLEDINEIERIRRDGGVGMNFYRTIDSPADKFRFKIYRFGESIPLSDAIPIFEHLGFKVIDEAGPHAIHMNDVENIQLILHDFGLTSMAGARLILKVFGTISTRPLNVCGVET